MKERPNKVRSKLGFCASAFCMNCPVYTPSNILAFSIIFMLLRHIHTRFIHIGEFCRQTAWCCCMTTYYDIPADMLIPALAEKMSEMKEIEQPDWSDYVKTGADHERPPTQAN